MWVAAERPPRTRAARLFVFSRTCVIISKPVTPCKTFRGNMAEFFNRLLVPERPGRREPRAVKRRPKPCAWLTKPRHNFKDAQHRNRYWKNKPKKTRA